MVEAAVVGSDTEVGASAKARCSQVLGCSTEIQSSETIAQTAIWWPVMVEYGRGVGLLTHLEVGKEQWQVGGVLASRFGRLGIEDKSATCCASLAANSIVVRRGGTGLSLF